jgi:Flp pilus assembly protein TadB
MFMGMAPIGALLAGVLAGWLGATTTVAIGGAFCFLAGAVFLTRLPHLREEARELLRAQQTLPADSPVAAELGSSVTEPVSS